MSLPPAEVSSSVVCLAVCATIKIMSPSVRLWTTGILNYMYTYSRQPTAFGCNRYHISHYKPSQAKLWLIKAACSHTHTHIYAYTSYIYIRYWGTEKSQWHVTMLNQWHVTTLYSLSITHFTCFSSLVIVLKSTRESQVCSGTAYGLAEARCGEVRWREMVNKPKAVKAKRCAISSQNWNSVL